jgi:hypothetical protein
VIVEKIYIGANSPTVTELVAKVVEILIWLHNYLYQTFKSFEAARFSF